MPVVIRALGAQDVAVARSLVRRFHSTDVSDRYLVSLLGNSANLLLAAEGPDGLVGFLYAHWIDRLKAERPQLFIYEVEVESAHRQVGIATSLLAEALSRARQCGARAFVLTNHSNLAAVQLYRKMGGIEKNGDDLLFVFG